MPSRLTSIAIITFWLAATGWYISRDVWPRISASAPPPYVIDLADEALRQVVPIRWTLSRNGKKVAPIRTSVKYDPEDDSFAMTSSILREVEFAVLGQQVTVRTVEDRYRVSRAGLLLGFGTDLTGSIQGQQFRLQLDATVKAGQAHIRCRLDTPFGVLEPIVPPYPITQAGVFNPLHPVNRIQGLRPGMKWRLPLVNPIADARMFAMQALLPAALREPLTQLTSSTSMRLLDAQVIGPMTLPSSSPASPVSCNVIEYHGEGYTGRTWLRIPDGTVLRQEAASDGEELVLERE